jgi:rSAM/selenodomain-associated transferase 2
LTVTASPATVKNEIRTYALDLAVIIPVLNAARMLSGTVAAIGPVRDLVVVDGGSRDDTPAVAERLGARVLTAPLGRGQQIAAGVAAVESGWVLILHADTRLEPGWRDAACTHMAQDPARAACFRFALDSDEPAARRLERMVAWRCRVLALPYGDQGLLIHTDLLRAMGGVRPLPLMEDVDLVRRLGRRRLVMLKPAAITSAEKWRRDGWWRRSARNLFCLGLWFLGVPPRLIARVYG